MSEQYIRGTAHHQEARLRVTYSQNFIPKNTNSYKLWLKIKGKINKKYIHIGQRMLKMKPIDRRKRKASEEIHGRGEGGLQRF